MGGGEGTAVFRTKIRTPGCRNRVWHVLERYNMAVTNSSFASLPAAELDALYGDSNGGEVE